MNKVLLDTDVVINLLKKREETLRQLEMLNEAEFYLSPIVIAEIFAGARANEVAQIEQFVSLCTSTVVDDRIGRIAGEYAHAFRKAYSGISLEDYMIAATAKAYGLTLWTHNQKHYPMDDIDKL